ncbi:Sec-independent protein translocase protein TatB [Acidihalobacter ferrooxydans]|uniref:Sec-independent protein translocase protein TatB n=1 Tax=Acidihalobacter ferrooxydans TaxID=1765967 RepID=A0A1P8UIF8_9GAMM|nr:Sec-independent protein translocase protein TatB [Acidihalobacter ferrooxydans]APZ43620.1 twin arginine-targeting protein translocase TatB [Acidihalobacter ferrooxydans]
MFDSGFSELMLIAIVALIVVGPERLPGLARKAGYWVGKFRRYVSTVRAEIEREINAEELRGMLSKQEDEIRELRDMLQDTRSQIRSEVDDISQEVGAVGEQLRQNVKPTAEETPAVEDASVPDAPEALPQHEAPATAASEETASPAAEKKTKVQETSD